MFPCAHLLSKCLRCADPAVERRIYEHCTLAIGNLRHVFLLALIACALLGFEIDQWFGAAAAGPAFVDCGVMGLLWLCSPLAPVACAVIGIAIFGASMIAFVVVSRVAPIAVLGDLRVIAVCAGFLLGLGVALHQAMTAHRLRTQQRLPRATVVAR